MIDEIAVLQDCPVENISYASEPVVRPDGYRVGMFEEARRDASVFVAAILRNAPEDGFFGSGFMITYTHEDLEAIGSGDINQGLMKIAKFLFKLPPEEFDDFYAHNSLARLIEE